MKSTNRHFGLFLAALLLVGYGLSFAKYGFDSVWLLVLSITFINVAIFVPDFFGPFFRLWQGLALGLNKITSPILMLIYFGFIFIPIGFCMRIFGAPVLLLEADRRKNSYWINVDIDGQSFESLKNQY